MSKHNNDLGFYGIESLSLWRYTDLHCTYVWQVCNLVWSKNVNELVSTHGYSQNQIIVWRYPAMSKVQSLSAVIPVYLIGYFLY